MSLDHAAADAPHHGLRPSDHHGLRPFDDVLAITEDAFVGAGTSLEKSLGRLQALRGVFAALETTLGAETELALTRQVNQVAAQGQHIKSGFGQIDAATGGLFASMADIRSEVRSLNETIRLIANIAINARIHGNSLLRPRPQINAFVARLSALSAEAETILAEVNAATALALETVHGINRAQHALSDELRWTTFPAIEAFTDAARRVSAEQPALRAASAAIADQMQQVSSEVGRLVTALQMGDTLRQRLEQVHAALALAAPNPASSPASSPDVQAFSFRLAAELTDGAVQESMPAIDDALAALTAIAARGKDIVRAATGSAFATGALRRAQSGDSAFATFDASLRTARSHFAAMQADAVRMREQIEIILGHDAALQRIAQHVRMAGINAVITCAKLDEDGRALRELAQWLRVISDECDSTMIRLQTALHASRGAVHGVADTIIAALDADFSAFLDLASALGATITTAHGALVGVSAQFDSVARDLDAGLAMSSKSLALVRLKLAESLPAAQMLHVFADLFPPPDLSGASAQEYLARIRGKYTMAAERRLHDTLVSQFSPTPETGSSPPAPPTVDVAPAPASAAEDLDDIFF